MRAFLALAAGGLLLAGCSTTTNDRIDEALQRNLPAICDSAELAHLAFLAVAPAADISPKTLAAEAAAWGELADLCEDPEGVTSAHIVLAAARAYTTITIALREAQDS